MNIPKQLKGKEVKRFIDEWQNKSSGMVLNKDACYYYYNDLSDLYNRSFKPEMITEYFEGWENIADEKMDANIFFYEKELRIVIYISTYIEEFVIDREAKRITTYIGRIKTLSDYIVFALSAGITLRWKENN